MSDVYIHNFGGSCHRIDSFAWWSRYKNERQKRLGTTHTKHKFQKIWNLKGSWNGVLCWMACSCLGPPILYNWNTSKKCYSRRKAKQSLTKQSLKRNWTSTLNTNSWETVKRQSEHQAHQFNLNSSIITISQYLSNNFKSDSSIPYPSTWKLESGISLSFSTDQ